MLNLNKKTFGNRINPPKNSANIIQPKIMEIAINHANPQRSEPPKSQTLTVFAHTLQVPSLLTMQAPMGFSGVQAFMNIGHSAGLILPIMTR